MKRCIVRAWLMIAGLLGMSGLSTSDGWCAEAGGAAQMRAEFSNPPFRYHSRPLWFWNGKLDADKTRAMVAACKKAGYCGMGILPCDGMGFDFMGPEFLKQYKAAIDEAGKLGMKMCLYDEFWFPSGSAGGLLAKKHPEALGKRLDMLATDVIGPKQFTQALPAGALMGAVAMETATKKRLDITASVKDGALRWDVPAGEWKVMIFTCVRDGGAGLVDYLEPKAVEAFIALTYQTYHDAMPAHFGTTIDSAFYDEPAFYHVQGGRAWTPRFNERFRERFHTDPVTLYPALWFDIGPDTAAARNALFGMRAELYATGFVKTISDWCAAHQMGLTGHADQEEVANPVIGTVGDLIKAFKYQSMPGIDQVFGYGRASRAYKVVSSAACNYDRPQVMVECYGGMDLPLPNLYKEAMDQFAKGINTMVPHAVWYDQARIIVQPDLSPGAAAIWARVACLQPVHRPSAAHAPGRSPRGRHRRALPHRHASGRLLVRSRRSLSGLRHCSRGGLHGRGRTAGPEPAARLHVRPSGGARREMRRDGRRDSFAQQGERRAVQGLRHPRLARFTGAT